MSPTKSWSEHGLLHVMQLPSRGQLQVPSGLCFLFVILLSFYHMFVMAVNRLSMNKGLSTLL